MTQPRTWDVAVVGAGAAGLATAIFAARAAPPLRIVCLDGATHIGAKILVSGGSRCNVTNRDVIGARLLGRVAASRSATSCARFPRDRAAAFFEELGVALHEEEDGKLFPDTNRARTVLDALLAEAGRLGVVVVQPGARVAASCVPTADCSRAELADGRRRPCHRRRAGDRRALVAQDGERRRGL